MCGSSGNGLGGSLGVAFLARLVLPGGLGVLTRLQRLLGLVPVGRPLPTGGSGCSHCLFTLQENLVHQWDIAMGIQIKVPRLPGLCDACNR